jgi:hypothetical protein
LARVIAPSPIDVSVDHADDLASAALGCAALSRARKLAEWVGSGKELTTREVLRPAVAAEACRALGIELPGARLRSALDVDELMLDWTVALEAEFIGIDGRKAYVSPGMAMSSDPESVLNAWLRAAAWATGVADEPCVGCIIVLHELSTSDRPLSVEELADAVATTEPEMADGQPCLDCGFVHEGGVLLGPAGLIGAGEPDELDATEHAEEAVEALVAFGAAASLEAHAQLDASAGPGGAVQLTPLGSMLARAVFEGRAPAADAAAETVMSAISDVPPPVAWTLARPWLKARSPTAAARELLALAESADGEQRIAALAFAREIGPGAAAAWREWAARPGFGAYARRWLADQGEPTAEDPADEAWLTVEALSFMLETMMPEMMPPSVVAEAIQEATGTDAAGAISLLTDSGHPAAPGIVALLTGQPDPMPPLPGSTR